MKRITSFILLICCLFCCAVPVMSVESSEKISQKELDNFFSDFQQSLKENKSLEEPPTYKDIRSNSSFVLPRNWKQAELSKDYDFIDAKFEDTYDPQ